MAGAWAPRLPLPCIELWNPSPDMVGGRRKGRADTSRWAWRREPAWRKAAWPALPLSVGMCGQVETSWACLYTITIGSFQQQDMAIMPAELEAVFC